MQVVLSIQAPAKRTFATTLTTLLSDLTRHEELIGGEMRRVQEEPDRNTISQ